jgi:hypothetical protein
VAVQDRLNQHSSFPYNLGVVVDAGNGGCVVTEVSNRQTINGTCFDKGDFAISVKWSVGWLVSLWPCAQLLSTNN